MNTVVQLNLMEYPDNYKMILRMNTDRVKILMLMKYFPIYMSLVGEYLMMFDKKGQVDMVKKEDELVKMLLLMCYYLLINDGSSTAILEGFGGVLIVVHDLKLS
jgi:hypothetical protein